MDGGVKIFLNKKFCESKNNIYRDFKNNLVYNFFNDIKITCFSRIRHIPEYSKFNGQMVHYRCNLKEFAWITGLNCLLESDKEKKISVVPS